MPQQLPPGMNAGDFDKAIDEIRKVVGDDAVYTGEGDALAPYLDHMSAVPPEYRTPSAAITPAEVAEVQGVLKVANKYKLPLWTYGNGKNFAYGGPAPLQAGYLMLDLKRMNRILDVDEEFGTCLVEPGVSYFQLDQHLRDIGSKLWIDCAAPGWGGVMGNALEHGAGYTPYADHFIMSCGMEVMLADGSLVRTGMGAMPNSTAWQLFKYGYGPHYDGMFTQGNFGIVTKMGFWLMHEPPAYKPFMLSFENEDDLAAIMEIARPLKLNFVIPNGLVCEHISYSVAVQKARREIWDKPEPVPLERWKEVAKEMDLGMWNMYGALYGTPENVEMSWKLVQATLGSIPGAKAYLQGDRDGDIGFDYRVKLMRGEPNMTEFNMVNWDGGGHLNFTPIAPISGRNAMSMFHVLRDVCEKHGFDYISESVATFRGMISLVMVMFDPRDEETRKRADACGRDIILTAAKHGWGELKANLAYMDLVAETYSGNDNGVWKCNQLIKDALDPNGILSPGKSGIWPSSWTGPRA